MLESLTVSDADIILHASGLFKGKKQFRSHYCDRADNPQLNALVALGYFTGPHSSALVAKGSAMFYLTEKGTEAASKLASRFNSFRCDCVGKDEEE